ncbi:hypothetical protein LCGC14_0413330 [marine sediment metagenome]|uniref:Uncharacterized protein n=1 Tax=marine sediment metagenome TaxID=412755 RepID=A0A0F9VF45_9ZZZZ
MTAYFPGTLRCDECGEMRTAKFALTSRGVTVVPSMLIDSWTAVENPRTPLEPTPMLCSDKCLLAHDARKRLTSEVIAGRVEIKKA